MFGFNSISENSISSVQTGTEDSITLGTVNLLHNDLAFRHLGSLGFVGSYNDRLLGYLHSFYGVTNLALNDLLSRYIKTNGYLLTSLFLPTDLPGLKLWLDASDASTITTAVGSAVSQWDDKGPDGRDATQSVDTQQPDTGLRTINGKNAINFDEVDTQFFEIASLTTTNTSIFIVLAVDDDASMDGVFGGGAGALSLRITNAEFPTLSKQAGATFITSSTKLVDGVGTLLGVTTGVTGSEMWLDGVSVGTDGTDPDYSAVSNRVGKAGGATMEGLIGEIIVYDGIIADTERASIENYLNNKWGL